LHSSKDGHPARIRMVQSSRADTQVVRWPSRDIDLA
jgi:hypothetical protein